MAETKTGSKRLNVSLDADLHTAVKVAAVKNNMTLGQFVVVALEHELEREKQEVTE